MRVKGNIIVFLLLFARLSSFRLSVHEEKNALLSLSPFERAVV